MDSQALSFVLPLAESAGDLTVMLVLFGLVIAGAVAFQFSSTLFDGLGLNSSLRPYFDESWGHFEDTVVRERMAPELAGAIRQWADETEMRNPGRIVDDRESFHRFLTQWMLRSQPDGQPAGSVPAVLHVLAEARSFREQRGLIAKGTEPLYSSREMQAPQRMYIEVLEEFQGQQRVHRIQGTVTEVNDAYFMFECEHRLTRRFQNLLSLGKEYWVIFKKHEREEYCFRPRLLHIDRNITLCIEHGRFLIKERRADPRYAYQAELAVTTHLDRQRRSIQVWVRDLSRSGIGLRAKERIEREQVLDFDLKLPEGEVLDKVQAMVVGVSKPDDDFAWHCQFTGLSDLQQESLDQALDILSEKTVGVI